MGWCQGRFSMLRVEGKVAGGKEDGEKVGAGNGKKSLLLSQSDK